MVEKEILGIMRGDGTFIPIESPDEHFGKLEFIPAYLRGKGERGAFVMEIYRAWKSYCITAGITTYGSYDQFRTTIWSLKKTGRIEKIPESEKTKAELNSKHTYNRSYYRLSRRRR